MKLLLLTGLTVVLAGCSNPMIKLGGNDLGVSYLTHSRAAYPAANKHCAQFSKKEKLIERNGGTFIFECI